MNNYWTNCHYDHSKVIASIVNVYNNLHKSNSKIKYLPINNFLLEVMFELHSVYHRHKSNLLGYKFR